MTLDAYGPFEEIGRGGMGLVLKGRGRDGGAVAVKVMVKPGSRRHLARFDRERRLLGELREAEGFVPLLDAGDSPRGPYLVMPFVSGGTLRDKLRLGPLSVKDTLTLGRTVARALGRAHALGIVHRDLKPENVLYTAKGEPLVADLGLAKHFRQDDPDVKSLSLSNPGMAVGTLGYMAPEQMRSAKDATPGVDVWAIGTILHECLAGQKLWRAPNVLKLVEKVEAGAIDPLPPEVPAWLVQVIERALAHDAKDRFADGAALADALGQEPLESRRGRVALALGAALVVLGALAAALIARRPPVPAPPATTGPVAALVASLTVVAPPPPRDDETEKPSKKERALLEDAETAEAKADRAGAYAAYFELGAKALEKDHPKLACQAFESAFTCAKGDDEELAALSQLGFAETRADRFESAAEHLRRAIKLSPRDSLLRNNLGYCLHVLGRDADALAQYRKSLDLDSTQSLPRLSLGILLRATGDVARALAEHETLRDDPALGAVDLGMSDGWYFRFESKAARAKAPGVSVASGSEKRLLVRLEVALDQVLRDDLAAADKAIEQAHELAFDKAELRAPVTKVLDDVSLLLERAPERYRLRFVAGLLHKLVGEGAEARAELEAFRVKEAEQGGRFAERARQIEDELK